MRKQKKYHYIYKTTNLIKGYFYYGMHSTNNLNDSYLGSGKRLRYSINKYGKENHYIEILEFLPSREELKKREEEIVNKEMLANPQCINLMIGGYGGFDFINKHQLFLKDGETRKEFNLRHSPFTNNSKYDADLVKEWRTRGSDAATKWNQKNGSALQKEQYQNGRIPGMLGKKHSAETISKLKGHTRSCKEKNSQFGKKLVWLNKDGIKRRIEAKDSEMITELLNDGWERGIKPKSSKIKFSLLKVCKTCKTLFEIIRIDRKHQKFCSVHCSNNRNKNV